MRKPIVGETLFSLNVGNRVSKYSPQKLTPVVVDKVGRKYFSVAYGHLTRRFYLSNWREVSAYSPTAKLYTSEEEWSDECKHDELARSIYQICKKQSNMHKLSINTLTSILVLLNSND